MTVQLDEQVICPILIGRKEELAALYSLIDVTRSGQSHTALISGEAGIGKSRLVAEAKNSALAQDFLPLQGSCFQTDISYPYAPILDLLRTLFAKRVPIPVTANQELFVNELVQLLPDLALLLPQLVPYSPAQALEPVLQKRRLFTVLTHFFSSQATQQPVLLIVEDIHWCDESSLAFLLYLIRHCTNLPLFFVFTYRNEENSPGLSHWLAQLDRERLALEIALKLLSLTEVDCSSARDREFGRPVLLPACTDTTSDLQRTASARA